MTGWVTDVVKISSPDKVMFPERGITKADLVGYYQRVSERMLPMLIGRPLTLHRFPGGIGGKGFMQKNVAKHFPESIQRFEVPRQEGGVTTYPVAAEADHIPWLANQGTITFHIWSSRLPDVATPDWLVLDLDPAAGDDGAKVRDVAFVVKEVLDEFGLAPTPVATGSKGFHLWLRLDDSHDHHQAAMANRALAGLVASRAPELATTEFLKKERKGRVFIDWLRANRGATVVAPLSIRATVNASVAAPATWDEVARISPDHWTIADVDQLVARPTLLERCDHAHRLPVDEIVAAARQAGVDLDTPFDRFGRKR